MSPKPLTSLVTTSLLVLVVACSPTDTSSSSTSSSSTTSAPQTTSTTNSPSTSASGNDIDTHLDWIVSLLNGEEITAEEYEMRFTPQFRAQVTFENGLQPILTDLRAGGPYRVTERTSDGQSGSVVVVASDGTELVLMGAVDADGRFSTLTIQPGEPPSLEDPPGSVEEAFDALAELGSVGAITAEIVGGACQPIEGIAVSEPVPLGSVFKLYVLAALGEAVNAGQASWTDEIVIREDSKSIPGGELQDRPDGTAVTVLEAAQLMISISDNTAADLLIDYLGRQTVEDAQARFGNSNAALNTPFLSTRELTALKVGPASGLRDPQWIEGDEAERRAILDQIADITVADLPLQEWTEPIDPDLVEWFASPNDLCDLAAHLIDLANEVPEIASILEINPGVPPPSGTWDGVWFKGGSEPGLMAAWWITETGGRTYLTAGSVVDPDAEIDQTRALLLLAAARDLTYPG